MVIYVIIKVLTVQLYLDCMEIIPSKPRTLVGIGVYLYGRKAMYVISLMIVLNQIALNMCYLIVLGKTLASWSIDVFQT